MSDPGAASPQPHAGVRALDVLQRASVRNALFPLLSTRTACMLRLVCAELRGAVAEFPWEDGETPIKGSLAAWRACLPRARAANVRGSLSVRAHAPLRDEDLAHLAGCTQVFMRQSALVTDAGLAHLRGVEVLDIGHCPRITDAGLAHLRGSIRSLVLDGNLGLTSAAFEHLVGIWHLSMLGCSQPALGDAAFAPLRGTIRSLNMSMCDQPAITSAAFVHLVGIQSLDMSHCSQRTITDAALWPLRGVRTLNMRFCAQSDFTAQAFAGLMPGLETLELGGASEDMLEAAREAGLGPHIRSW